MIFFGEPDRKLFPDPEIENLTIKHGSVNSDGDNEYYSNNEISVWFSGVLYGQEFSKDLSINNKMGSLIGIMDKFVREGAAALAVLNGKYIIIVETPEKVYVIRDINGTGSPVYYSDTFFTNAFRLIRKVSGIELKPDVLSVCSFLKDGFIPAPYSSIEGIRKLGPGEYLEFIKGERRFKLHSGYNFESYMSDAGSLKISVAEAIEVYYDLHRQSIRRSIAGNGEAGVLLSGGFDSGGNLAALRDVYNGHIIAFSAGFENNPWSELSFASLMAERFEAQHEVIYLKPSDIESLPEIIKYLGDPFFESGMMLNYKVARETGSSYKGVLLGGDGNDQLFGTTGRELALLMNSHKNHLVHLQNLFGSMMYDSDRFFRLAFYNRNILESPFLRQLGFTYNGSKKIMKPGLCNPSGFVNMPQEILRTGDFNSLYFWRNFHTDIIQSAQQVILFKAESMSRMNNMNLAFPYFDNELSGFVGKLPREYKLKGSVSELIKGEGISKFIFKQYLRNTLPADVVSRKKQGGFAPLSIFLADDVMRGKIYSIIRGTLPYMGLFRDEILNDFILSVESAVKADNKWFWYRQTKFNQLFIMLSLAIWWKINILSDYRYKLSDYSEKIIKK